MVRSKWLWVGVVCWGTALAGTAVRAADEAALWRLWSRQQARPDDHAAHAAAYGEFAAARPDDPLAPLAGTLAAWHYLKADRSAEAQEWLERYDRTARAPTARGASRLARAWLTRLDREKVVAALDVYRTREVRFPDRLDRLPAHAAVTRAGLQPPLEDRWGQSWVYQLEAMRALTGLTGQRYTLESRRLGDTSDLGKALAAPYGDRVRLDVVRVLAAGRSPSVQLVHPEDPEAPIVLTPGAQHENIRLEYVGEHLVILHDDLHWNLLRVPGAAPR